MGYRLVISEPANNQETPSAAMLALWNDLIEAYPSPDSEDFTWTEPPALIGSSLHLNIRFIHAAEVLEEVKHKITLTGLTLNDPQLS